MERARQRMAHDVEMMRQDHNREMEEIRSQLQEAVIKAVQRGEQEKRTAVESMQVRMQNNLLTPINNLLTPMVESMQVRINK